MTTFKISTAQGKRGTVESTPTLQKGSTEHNKVNIGGGCDPDRTRWLHFLLKQGENIFLPGQVVSPLETKPKRISNNDAAVHKSAIIDIDEAAIQLFRPQLRCKKYVVP